MLHRLHNSYMSCRVTQDYNVMIDGLLYLLVFRPEKMAAHHCAAKALNQSVFPQIHSRG